MMGRWILACLLAIFALSCNIIPDPNLPPMTILEVTAPGAQGGLEVSLREARASRDHVKITGLITNRSTREFEIALIRFTLFQEGSSAIVTEGDLRLSSLARMDSRKFQFELPIPSDAEGQTRLEATAVKVKE